MAEVIVLDYEDEQIIPFSHLFAKFWRENEGREPKDLMEYEGPNGPTVGNEMQLKMYSYLNEGAKVKLAYRKQKLIGFMIYHWIFNSVLIARAMYIEPDFRHGAIPRRLIFSVGKVKRMFSQTYKDKGSVEIQGKKVRRNLISDDGEIQVWENVSRR